LHDRPDAPSALIVLQIIRYFFLPCSLLNSNLDRGALKKLVPLYHELSQKQKRENLIDFRFTTMLPGTLPLKEKRPISGPGLMPPLVTGNNILLYYISHY